MHCCKLTLYLACFLLIYFASVNIYHELLSKNVYTAQLIIATYIAQLIVCNLY